MATTPEVPSSSTGSLSDAERRELDELRTEVARLRATVPAGVALRPRRHGGWRWATCVVLIVLAGVLAIASVAARHVRSELLDTDRYVATVAPIGESPAVRSEVIDKVTTAITDKLHLTANARDLLGAVADSDRLPPKVADRLPDLAPALAQAGDDLVRREVTKLVDSPEFGKLWVTANRDAHNNLVSVLTGHGTTALQADANGNVTVSLGPVVDRVKERLVTDGIGAAANIPDTNVTFTLVQSDKAVKAQRLTSLLDAGADALPWVAVAFGLAGVWAAPRGRRLRAGIVAGLVLAGAMAVLGLGLTIGRSIYLNAIPGSVLSASAAEAIIDPLLAPVRTMLRAFFAVGLIVALACYLLGGGRSASALRRLVARGVDRLRGRHTPTAFELWMGRYRVPLEALVLAGGVAVLVTRSYPSGGTVLAIGLVTALLAFVVYGLGVRPSAAEVAGRGSEGFGSDPAGRTRAPQSREPASAVSTAGDGGQPHSA